MNKSGSVLVLSLAMTLGGTVIAAPDADESEQAYLAALEAYEDGRYLDAAEHAHMALGITTTDEHGTIEPMSPAQKQALTLLADYEASTGRLDDAKAHYEALLEELLVYFSPRHPEVLRLKHRIAQISGDVRADRTDDPRALYEAMLDELLVRYTPNHPAVVRLKQEIAELSRRDR